MITSYDQPLNIPYVLDEESLRKVYLIFFKEFKKITIRANCNDSTYKEFYDLEELLNFENNSSRRILELRLESFQFNHDKIDSDEEYKRAELHFRNARYLPPVNLEIKGEDKFVQGFKDEIGHVLEGIKPWYWFISKCNFISLFQNLLLIICLFMFLIGLYLNRSNLSGTFEEININWLFISLLIASPFLLGWPLNKLRNALFPSSFFKLGQQKNKYDQLLKIQGWFFKFLIPSGLILSFFKIAFFH